MRTLSIRAKLTLWYLLVTFAGALLFGITSYGVLQYALLQAKKTTTSLDEQLRKYALITHEGNLFEVRRPDGTLFFPFDPKIEA